MKCVIMTCKNYQNIQDGISYHRFTIERSDIRQEWIKFVRRANNNPEWSLGTRSVICSYHFESKDLIKGKKRTKVAPNAIPKFISNVDPNKMDTIDVNFEEMGCCIKTCRNKPSKTKGFAARVSYHRFPMEQEQAEQWVSLIGEDKNKFNWKNKRICSDHFPRECFLKQTYLISTAVPSLYINISKWDALQEVVSNAQKLFDEEQTKLETELKEAKLRNDKPIINDMVSSFQSDMSIGDSLIFQKFRDISSFNLVPISSSTKIEEIDKSIEPDFTDVALEHDLPAVALEQVSPHLTTANLSFNTPEILSEEEEEFEESEPETLEETTNKLNDKCSDSLKSASSLTNYEKAFRDYVLSQTKQLPKSEGRLHIKRKKVKNRIKKNKHNDSSSFLSDSSISDLRNEPKTVKTESNKTETPEQLLLYCCTQKNCDKKFKKNVELKYHMTTHDTTLTSYKCFLCEKYFQTEANVKTHLQLAHNNSQRKKNYECHQCNASYASQNRLRYHTHFVHGNLTFKCEHCENSFNTFFRLRHHMDLRHRGEKLINRSVYYSTTVANEFNDLNHGIEKVDTKIEGDKGDLVKRTSTENTPSAFCSSPTKQQSCIMNENIKVEKVDLVKGLNSETNENTGEIKTQDNIINDYIKVEKIDLVETDITEDDIFKIKEETRLISETSLKNLNDGKSFKSCGCPIGYLYKGKLVQHNCSHKNSRSKTKSDVIFPRTIERKQNNSIYKCKTTKIEEIDLTETLPKNISSEKTMDKLVADTPITTREEQNISFDNMQFMDENIKIEEIDLVDVRHAENISSDKSVIMLDFCPGSTEMQDNLIDDNIKDEKVDVVETVIIEDFNFETNENMSAYSLEETDMENNIMYEMKMEFEDIKVEEIDMEETTLFENFNFERNEFKMEDIPSSESYNNSAIETICKEELILYD